MPDAGYQIQGQVAVVGFGEPPVNSRGLATRNGLLDALEAAAADPGIAAVVVTGHGKFFSAGADISEFDTSLARESPTLHDIIEWLDASDKPVVAAINGTCLGGGLELALACHHRVATVGAQLGFPEVQIGVVPGAGGTQRLPRVAGVAIALELIASGKPQPAAKLEGTALIDRVVDADPVPAAVELAAARAGKPPRRARDLVVDEPRIKELCDDARTNAQRAHPHEPAYARSIDAIEASALAWEEGLAFERKLFDELVPSPESLALRHAFFAERAASKIDDIPPSTPTRELARAAVVGGGTMGSGIALNFLYAGIPTSLLEVDADALEAGVQRIRKVLDSRLERGRITPERHASAVALLEPTLSYADLAPADIVIEAVFEDMQVKKAVFAELDASMKPGAILATNTSTLDINEIAAMTSRPADVVGTHFFSPAHVMRLLEVVRGEATAPDVLATVMKLAKRIKKTAVVSRVCDGFIGNRMLHQYLKQAGYLIEEGASPQQVDTAIEDFGMAMGPFRMSDLAGNDIGWAVRKRHYAENPDFIYPTAPDTLCELGRFGQKTQGGWYDYEPGDRTARPSVAVDQMLVEHRKSLRIEPRSIADDEIVDRLILALVNEAALIIEEGIAARASDIDVVYLTGYGFPRWRGGPWYYARQRGFDAVVERIEEFALLPHGDSTFWMPSPLLCEGNARS